MDSFIEHTSHALLCVQEMQKQIELSSQFWNFGYDAETEPMSSAC